VVRWYGGIKLGTGGLSRAYRDTAAETLKLGKPLDRYLYTRIRVAVPFASLNNVYRLIDPPHVLLAHEEFGDETVFGFDVRLSREEAFTNRLRELRLATLP
jgi:putative IMPACT (imprinted ancient) family translation regulator